MKTTGYFVYKYVMNNEVVYIGHTEDLEQRSYTHHIDEYHGCELWYLSCSNKYEMMCFESYLIRHYRPRYNSAYSKVEAPTYVISGLVWKRYTKESKAAARRKTTTLEELQVLRELFADVANAIRTNQVWETPNLDFVAAIAFRHDGKTYHWYDMFDLHKVEREITWHALTVKPGVDFEKMYFMAMDGITEDMNKIIADKMPLRVISRKNDERDVDPSDAPAEE